MFTQSAAITWEYPPPPRVRLQVKRAGGVSKASSFDSLLSAGRAHSCLAAEQRFWMSFHRETCGVDPTRQPLVWPRSPHGAWNLLTSRRVPPPRPHTEACWVNTVLQNLCSSSWRTHLLGAAGAAGAATCVRAAPHLQLTVSRAPGFTDYLGHLFQGSGMH